MDRAVEMVDPDDADLYMMAVVFADDSSGLGDLSKLESSMALVSKDIEKGAT